MSLAWSAYRATPAAAGHEAWQLVLTPSRTKPGRQDRRNSAVQQAVGRNLRIDFRWAAGNADWIRMFAKELVGLQPDVILAHTTPVTAALQRETRTIPIVFLGVADPVGDGFVAGRARPGGNITGFINLEGAIAGKWLECAYRDPTCPARCE
jgi:hypothetical protein